MHNNDCFVEKLQEENKELQKENSKHKLTLDIIEEYCMQCNLRWDFTAQFILNTINKLKKE